MGLSPEHAPRPRVPSRPVFVSTVIHNFSTNRPQPPETGHFLSIGAPSLHHDRVQSQVLFSNHSTRPFHPLPRIFKLVKSAVLDASAGLPDLFLHTAESALEPLGGAAQLLSGIGLEEAGEVYG